MFLGLQFYGIFKEIKEGDFSRYRTNQKGGFKCPVWSFRENSMRLMMMVI